MTRASGKQFEGKTIRSLEWSAEPGSCTDGYWVMRFTDGSEACFYRLMSEVAQAALRWRAAGADTWSAEIDGIELSVWACRTEGWGITILQHGVVIWGANTPHKVEAAKERAELYVRAHLLRAKCEALEP